MATPMEFEDSYTSRELEAVRKMMNSSSFPAPENNTRGVKYREEEQYGPGHDGEEQRDKPSVIKAQTSYAIFKKERRGP